MFLFHSRYKVSQKSNLLSPLLLLLFLPLELQSKSQVSPSSTSLYLLTKNHSSSHLLSSLSIPKMHRSILIFLYSLRPPPSALPTFLVLFPFFSLKLRSMPRVNHTPSSIYFHPKKRLSPPSSLPPSSSPSSSPPPRPSIPLP